MPYFHCMICSPKETIMKRTIALYLISGLITYACVPKAEKEKLEMENEELRAELTRAQMTVSTLEEIGSLIDSIDKARNALRIELEAGTDYNDYLERMNDINDYVSVTESKLDQLEKELNTTSAKNQSYIKTISRMKKDLAQKSLEISQLQGTVDKYKQENTSLLNIVDLRETQITDLEEDISMKLQELDFLENRVREMMKKAQVSEADSYYALGEALEEAARRTKLAPKKKKETYKEAVEYYKKALAFGREDAQEKITALEKRI
jgi:chromosome segregation ATPase